MHHHHHHHHHHHQPNKFAVIRNPHSGFVLDASANEVKIQHYTGFPSQLWRLDDAGAGKFFFVNKANGKVLDIAKGVIAGNNLITYQKNGGLNQQWFINSDNTIVCAGGELALDICRENYSAGNHIIAYPKHGRSNQQFVLQYQ